MAYVIGEDCVACGTCQSACPTGAISEGDIYKIDPDVCISCGSCAEVCPSGAITEGEFLKQSIKIKKARRLYG